MEEPLPSSEEAWTPELIEFDEMIHAIGAKTSELSEETQERVEYFLLDMCDGVVIEPSQAKTASEGLQSFIESDVFIPEFIEYYHHCSREDQLLIIDSILYDSDEAKMSEPMMRFLVGNIKDVIDSLGENVSQIERSLDAVNTILRESDLIMEAQADRVLQEFHIRNTEDELRLATLKGAPVRFH